MPSETLIHDESAPHIMWNPPKGRITNMDRFREFVNQKYEKNFKRYEELRAWSCDEYDKFWAAVWEFCEIVHSKTYDEVVDMSKTPNQIPEWFRGSRLNFAENLLRFRDDRVALACVGEARSLKKYTYSQLYERVARMAAALRHVGVKTGDRVCGYIPNDIEAIEVILATASIGATWSSTSPDFGVTGVLERFSQIKPKVIFTVNAVVYNGKVHDHIGKVKQVVDGIHELEHVVIIPYVPDHAFDLSEVPHGVMYNDFVAAAGAHVPELTFEQLPFNHPMYIMFSSGTTGVPKCMVHSTGGTLIQHKKEHILHGNLTRDDTILYYTTTGWMMHPWLISALSVGATVVLYDGSPFKPHNNVLWDLVDEVGITIFGTSAKWLATCEDLKMCPMKTNKLTTMHTILSTGSPFKPESFDYVYRDVKKDVLLGSITGGTDLISCFAGSNPTLPVVRGEVQSRNLGMKVEAWVDGKMKYDVSGELVCTAPFPSMPVYFLNDDDGSKYQKAYFVQNPGVWSHGDFCCVSSQTNGIVMLGRSDGTLNPSGVRFGSAEIYNITDTFPEVQDSLCVGQMIGCDERVVLFLKLRPNVEFTDALVKKMQVAIRSQLSARHVPAVILPIEDIPYTINGKKVEVAVKKIISSGEAVTHRGALANPASLDLYYNIPALQV
eukprot:Colp12_sorted_trinity150504_noHs@25257